MSPVELRDLVIGTLTGLGVSTVFLLALFIGFCVLLNFPKLRRSTRHSLVHRSLDERLKGTPTVYLLPDAPRGPADQLKTPELLEEAARKLA